MEWVNQARSFRLDVEWYADGWGWASWQERVGGVWTSLPPPAPENARRRFRFRPQAEEFFCLMAEILADLPSSGAGYKPPRRDAPRATNR